MKHLADSDPGTAANKVSTKVAETARVSAALHSVPQTHPGYPSPSWRSQLISGCLSVLLAGIPGCQVLDWVIISAQPSLAAKSSPGLVRSEGRSGVGAGDGCVGGGL